jgi:hypothetical protein
MSIPVKHSIVGPPSNRLLEEFERRVPPASAEIKTFETECFQLFQHGEEEQVPCFKRASLWIAGRDKCDPLLVPPSYQERRQNLSLINGTP